MRTPRCLASVAQRSSQQVSGGVALDAGLVAEEPEELEVGILAALEHGEEVELDVGLAGEGDVVAQDAEVEAVGDEGPEVVVGAVEELLHHGVRAFLGGALGSGGALVDADACAEEVDGDVAPVVGDFVGVVVDLDGEVALELAVAELAEEGAEEAVPGPRRGWCRCRFARRGRS